MEQIEKEEIDYRELFRKQYKIEKILKVACPDIDHKPGIYFLIREDHEGKHIYIGKAVDLMQRMVSHMRGYQQRIDISLSKKRGLYSEENKDGWKLNVLHFKEEELDEKEAYYINLYRNAKYDLYNIESGGTTGKTMINERFGPKTYTEGIARGKTTLRKDLNYIIEKYLVITTKKDNVSHQKALNKFYMLLKEPEKPEKESQE